VSTDLLSASFRFLERRVSILARFCCHAFAGACVQRGETGWGCVCHQLQLALVATWGWGHTTARAVWANRRTALRGLGVGFRVQGSAFG
jgi:hypothetical protein